MNQEIENLYKELLEDTEKAKKYNCAGVYSISLQNDTEKLLIYIGKSHNMLHRFAEHMVATKHDRTHKYTIMRNSFSFGYWIQFDVLYYAKAKNPYTELLKLEAYYINKLRPPLNIQIPDMRDPTHYTINKSAYTWKIPEQIKGATPTKE